MQKRNNVFHPNAMRTLETLAPKRFIYKPKKVKKPSTLKKRILLERLKKQLVLQLKAQKEQELQQDIQTDERKKVLHLYNLTDDVNLEDEDELQEIVANIKEILSPFAPLKRLSLHSSDSSSSSGQHGVKSYVEIEFYRGSSAENAVKMLNGLVIAGTAVIAVQPNTIEVSLAMPDQSETTTSTTQPPSETDSSSSSISKEDRVLVLRNLITADDIEDEETLIETLNDMQTLSRPFSQGLKSMWIEHAGRAATNHRLPFTDLSDDSTLFQDASFPFPLTLMELTDTTLACDVIHGLQDTVVGGNALQVGLATHKLEYAKHWQCPIINREELLNGKEGFRCSIMIHDFVTYEQVENEDERQEIVDDIKLIFANAWNTCVVSNVDMDGSEGFAIDKIVFILNPDAGLVSTSSVHVVLTLTCKTVHAIVKEEAVGHVENISEAVVEDEPMKKKGKKLKSKKEVVQPQRKPVTSCKHHAIVADQLHQTIIGGACLRTSILYVNEDFVTTNNTTGEQPQEGEGTEDVIEVSLMSFEDFNAVSLAVSTVEGHCVLAVSQYVTVEDITEEVVSLNDPETIMTCKRDFLQLLNQKHLLTYSDGYDKLVQLSIAIPASLQSSSTAGSLRSNATNDATEYLLCMKFNSSTDNHGIGKSLSDALTYFDGLVVSGVSLSAEIEAAGNHDMAKSIICVDVTKSLFGKSNAQNVAAQYRLLPSEFYHCAFQEEFAMPDIAVSGSVTEIDESAITLPRGRYAAAKQAPRLQIHRNPEKSIPVATEEVNAIIKDFLKLISTFQQRLKEKNPTKVKQKLRFVAGIKQSLSGVKAKKARIVFIAPNTEASEELDSRLDELVNQAKQREIPVVYCLSKRLLGKAVQMTIKQSVITVFDPDGAYDLFKKILRFVVPPS